MVYTTLFVFLLGVYSGVKAAPRPCGDFRFANYYGDHMVLQGSPGSATVWGYTPNVGDQVTVDIGQSSVVVTSELGEENLPVWQAEVGPFDGGPYTVMATSDGCSLTLEDVLFGDVWVCSGQSNMEFPMGWVENAEEELAKVANYPEIRTLHPTKVFSDEPLWEPSSIARQWAISTAENMTPFSAVCWIFAQTVYDRVKRPMGLIDNSYPGSRIEAWSSPEANYACFGDEGPPENVAGVNAVSALWNGSVHPYLRMTIFGVAWYQGETNQLRPADYMCSLPVMIIDWRQRWSQSSATAQDFPFGQVQIGTQDDVAGSTQYTELRWVQTQGYGYCPNEVLQRVFMAVALDLPDFDSPYSPIHPRYKRQIGERLALGAFPVAYGIHDMGIYQGPLPTSIDNEGNHFEVTYDNGNADLNIKDNSFNIGFDLCCSSAVCETSSSSWTHADILASDQSGVRVENTCAEDVMGLRYVWRESPCDFESCFIYSVENDLPAPPYLYEGDLSGANIEIL